MRRWVGLVLSALGLLAAVPDAGAATFTSPSPQEALDLASNSPGPDDVVLGPDDYELSTGLVYSDRGQADNHVTIRAGDRCTGGRYQQCRRTQLGGGSPGTVLLSFTGGGGADVAVSRIIFEPRNGATALALPPGGSADNVLVVGEGESTGIRLEGTASRPAIVRNFSSAFGSVAVDAPGHGVVENTRLEGGVGARSSGAGSLDIRGGSITALTGVTGPRVSVTGTLIDFGDPARIGGGQPVGIDTRCAGAGSADAEATVTNATIIGHGQPGTIGVRALGRGGDGDGCNATVRLSSTIVHAADVSLDASGEAGSGADPRDGVARIEAAYSNFVLEQMRQSGPAELQTSSPGQNVYGDPGLVPGYRTGQLLWSSPLVDAGDPAPLEGWQEFWIQAVHGRRDIGAVEYGFNSPHLSLGLFPGRVVPRGALVVLNADRFDADEGDPLALRWRFSDGATSTASVVRRRFRRLGNYAVRVTLTDPTGLTDAERATIQVVRQRLLKLRLRPNRFRAGAGATIALEAAAADRVVFHLDRRTRHRRSPRVRWTPLAGSLKTLVSHGLYEFPFFGRFDRPARPLRPGVYRLTATARAGGRPIRTRFRILR